jgi:hypothetical protein
MNMLLLAEEVPAPFPHLLMPMLLLWIFLVVPTNKLYA